MLTITGVSGTDSAIAANERLQPSGSQAQELIAIRPPLGNPHLAWLDILEKADDDRKRSDHHTKAQKSVYNSHNRYSVDRKERHRYEEEKEKKKYQKDKKRKEEDKGKYRERGKKNECGDLDRNSPNYEGRHHKKKKKKRSRSPSPRPDASNHHRHKSKHKKKKY